MGVPKFVTGAILDQEYNPDSKVFSWGAKFRDDNEREYILIKFNNGVGNVSAAEGQFLCGMDISYSKFEGTNDCDDPEGINQLIYGQMQCAPDDGKGVWCQYKGPTRKAITTDGDVAKDNPFTGSLATDGAVKLKSAVTEATVGIALEDDDATSLAAGRAYLTIPL